MEALGYYNGRFGPLDQMTVPMNDRACYFGDGVYDATYARNRIPFALEEHIERFFRSAALLRIRIEPTKAELAAILREMTGKVDGSDKMVYWQISRGSTQRTHAFPEGDAPGNLWIMIYGRPVQDLARPVKLVSAEDTRFLHCNIKTINLIPSVMAAQQAKEAGCYETVFHRGARVTECSHSNVHILRDGVLKTAPADNLILPGIARRHLIDQCRAMGVPVEETPYTMEELMAADEVLVTSSGAFCARAQSVDGVSVGGRASALVGELQRALTAEFLREVGEK